MKKQYILFFLMVSFFIKSPLKAQTEFEGQLNDFISNSTIANIQIDIYNNNGNDLWLTGTSDNSGYYHLTSASLGQENIEFTNDELISTVINKNLEITITSSSLVALPYSLSLFLTKLDISAFSGL